ncbi:SgcJ/EcaC family oxidoreductase [Pendulispora rubella]|uniref:SgcJ/EcaC family oxidoreductase n=1 Tax=Pendulispora rubella TaxID=2741070 RepID=A0ABZ2LDM9_9BACT
MNDVRHPRDMNEAFAQAVNSGSIDALLALYEPDAVLIGQDGSERRGLAAIREELTALLALGGKIEAKNRFAVTLGDTALLSADWKLETTTPDGAPLVVGGRTAEVVRRQPDGRWLYVLDHPSAAT